MVMNILADLKSTGAVTDAVLTKCLLDSGDIRIVWNGFAPTVYGEPTAERVLIALHKSGTINAVKLIGETIGNLRSSIESESFTDAQKVAKIDEAIEYLKVVRGLLVDGGEKVATFPDTEKTLDDAYDENDSYHAITVLG
jgi:hypothetical protein